MKRSKSFFSFAAIILCLLCIFSSCTKTPSENVSQSGEGGSDIAVEDTTTPQRAEFSSKDKLIALTFDDGPSKKSTNRILDLLESNGSAATFFIVGYNIEKNLATIERAQSLGCEIANHSNDHVNLTKCSAAEISKQVNTPNETLKSLTGVAPALFRAPGGNFKDIEDEIGMPIIQWSIDTNDWRYKDASNQNRSESQRNADLERISQNVINSAESGDIVLMHDIYDFTADLCELIIPGLIEKGFKLVTVSEMYEAYGNELEGGKVYYSIDVVPADVEAVEPGNYKVKTNGGALNIRAEKSSSAESLTKISNGTAVVVLRAVPGWAYVEYGSVRGWVNASFLEKM